MHGGDGIGMSDEVRRGRVAHVESAAHGVYAHAYTPMKSSVGACVANGKRVVQTAHTHGKHNNTLTRNCQYQLARMSMWCPVWVVQSRLDILVRLLLRGSLGSTASGAGLSIQPKGPEVTGGGEGDGGDGQPTAAQTARAKRRAAARAKSMRFQDLIEPVHKSPVGYWFELLTDTKGYLSGKAQPHQRQP